MSSNGVRRDSPSDRLTTIERLLKEYHVTRDRRLLRRAIELWDEIEVERALLTSTSRTRIH
jgi:hypothetical protein